MNHFRVEMGDVHENGLSVAFAIYDDCGGDDEGPDITGWLAWDGCLNWRTEEDFFAHFCEPAHAVLLADAFREVWRQGAVLLGDKWIGGGRQEPAA